MTRPSWDHDLTALVGGDIPQAMRAKIANRLETTFTKIDLRIAELLDALQDIADTPERGGCDDGVDAVELWQIMQRKARAALDADEGKR